MDNIDWESMRGFLVGHCNKTERDCYYVTMREFLDLRQWYEAEERRKAEDIRWQKFIDARMNASLKTKPNSPVDLYRLPWEVEAVSVSREDCHVTEKEAEALSRIFSKKQ